MLKYSRMPKTGLSDNNHLNDRISNLEGVVKNDFFVNAKRI